jgi:hypothetical protein
MIDMIRRLMGHTSTGSKILWSMVAVMSAGGNPERTENGSVAAAVSFDECLRNVSSGTLPRATHDLRRYDLNMNSTGDELLCPGHDG